MCSILLQIVLQNDVSAQARASDIAQGDDTTDFTSAFSFVVAEEVLLACSTMFFSPRTKRKSTALRRQDDKVGDTFAVGYAKLWFPCESVPLVTAKIRPRIDRYFDAADVLQIRVELTDGDEHGDQQLFEFGVRAIRRQNEALEGLADTNVAALRHRVSRVEELHAPFIE